MERILHLPAKPERHRRFGSVEAVKGIKPTDKEQMKDIQNTPNDYFFDIDHVGVSNVSHPILIASSLKPFTQTTIGAFFLYDEPCARPQRNQYEPPDRTAAALSRSKLDD